MRTTSLMQNVLVQFRHQEPEDYQSASQAIQERRRGAVKNKQNALYFCRKAGLILTNMINLVASDSSSSGLAGNPFFPPIDGRCIINELPPELLAHIFEIGAQDTADEDNDVEEDNNSDGLDSLSQCSEGTCDVRNLPFELMITRVCKQWRAVATNLPSLWTALVYDDPYEGSLDKNRVYLERAKGAPLRISIDFTFDEEQDEDEDEALLDLRRAPEESLRYDKLNVIMALLTPHVAHWQSFELMVGHYILMQLALEALGACAPAPLLQTFNLYHYADDPDDSEADFEPPQYTVQPFVLFQNSAPRLASVALSGVHLDWTATQFLVGLEELELAYHAPNVRPSYRDFLRILKASPHLASLTLCESGPAGMPLDWLQSLQRGEPLEDASSISSGNEKVHTTYTITSLQSFILAFVPPEYAIALLDRILMPNVRSLALEFEDDDADYASLLSRLASPAPNSRHSLLANLVDLKLSGLRCRQYNAILEAGKELQNLRHLNINFTHVDIEWLDALVDPSARLETDDTILPGTVYFPQLETVSISGLDSESLRELVTARKTAGRPLRELLVNDETELIHDDWKWFRENVEVFDMFEGSDGDETVFDDDEEDDFDQADFYDYEVDVPDAFVIDEDEDEENGEWVDED